MSRVHPRRPAARSAILLLALVASGCASSERSADASPSVGLPSIEANDEHAISPGADPGGPVTSQSETEWGRIWDRLPDDFPVYPDAVPSEELPDEPVSGIHTTSADAAEVATWMQAALEEATYSTRALSGPFDDGSIVIDSVGDAGCRIETTLAPRDGTTVITVRYGADCPYD